MTLRPSVHWRTAVTAACVAPWFALAGCSSSPSSPNAGPDASAPATTAGATHTPSATSAAAAADGTWSGTWTRTSPPPGNGTMTLILHQQGSALTGTISVQSSACLTDGSITGTVNGSALTMHADTPAVAGGKATGDYVATVAGDKLTGTLTVTCPVGVGVGTFDLSRG